MSRAAVQCQSGSGESQTLRQFRRSRPRLEKRIGKDAWKKGPLNRKPFRPLTDAEKRRALRNPRIDEDPYARLEFFSRDDLEHLQGEESPQTALPVEDSDIVPAVVARQEILSRLDKIRAAEWKQQLQDGDMTPEEVNELHRQYQKAQKDPLLPFQLDRMVNDPDETTVIYPKESDLESVDRSTMSFVEQLNFDYRVPGYIDFEKAIVQDDIATPIVRITHCNGEQVVVSLHGGCVLSWHGSNGRNKLTEHPDEVFDNRTAITKSGIGLAFPVFGGGFGMPYDGFVNSLLWDVVRTEVGADWLPDPAPSVTFFCRDNEETRKIWPHSFEIYYKITLGENDDFDRVEAPLKEQRRLEERLQKFRTLKEAIEDHKLELEAEETKADRESKQGGKKKKKSNKQDEETEDDIDEFVRRPDEIVATQLRLQIAVRNTGDKPMDFMCAARTHLSTRGQRIYRPHIRILGLRGRHYLDYNIVPGRPLLRQYDEDYLVVGDRAIGWNAVFADNTKNDVYFCAGHHEYFESINRKGFPDVLLHQPNPDAKDSPPMAEFSTMLGRGRVTVPAKLQPGEIWEGDYVLRHHSQYFREPSFGYQGTVPPPDESEIVLPAQSLPTTITDIQH